MSATDESLNSISEINNMLYVNLFEFKEIKIKEIQGILDTYSTFQVH